MTGELMLYYNVLTVRLKSKLTKISLKLKE